MCESRFQAQRTTQCPMYIGTGRLCKLGDSTHFPTQILGTTSSAYDQTSGILLTERLSVV